MTQVSGPVFLKPPSTLGRPAIGAMPPVLGVAPPPAQAQSYSGSYSEMPMRPSHAAPGRNWLGMGALLAAVVGLFFQPFPFGVLALVLGGYALWTIAVSPSLPGKNLAITSVVVGLFNILFWVVWTISHIEVGLGS